MIADEDRSSLPSAIVDRFPAQQLGLVRQCNGISQNAASKMDERSKLGTDKAFANGGLWVLGDSSACWRPPAMLKYGMAIKAIMVDVDGVLIVHPDACGWSVDLERDLGISVATLQAEFFLPHWDDIIHGRAPLRDRLGPVLQELRPQVTCDALIDYWFSADAHVNSALLAEIAVVRANGVEIHLATVQEHERAHYLWNVLDFRSQFDGLHYSAELGHAKPAAGFYRSIEHRTGFEPQDLFLIDDKIANVEAARSRGWAAALWTGADPLRSLVPSVG